MHLIYSFTVALFLTIALIPLLIRFSSQLQLLDDPEDDRKVHDRVIPRSGGLAIVLGVFLPLLFLLPIEHEFKGLIWGSVAIVVFGYLDDRYELDYRWKFFGQFIAIFAAMAGGIGMFQVPFMGLEPASLWISLPLTFMFLLGTTNAVNLSDGLDGLAAGTSLLSLALITLFSLVQGTHSIALVALTVIGGLLGFLRYNTFPAQIFMGDTGSQFLGYMVACLAIMVSQGDQSAISPVLPLLILGLPILDTLTVMVIRIKEKRSPFSPDKNHLHHQLMSLGLQHYQAVGAIYIIQMALMVSAYLLRYESDLLLLSFYAIFSTAIITCLYIGHKKKVSEPISMADLEPEERRNFIFRKLNWIYKNSGKVVEYGISAILILCAISVMDVGTDIAMTGLILFAVLLALCIVARKRTHLLARVCCYSASVSIVYAYSLTSHDVYYRYFIYGLYTAVVLFLMLAIRMTRRNDFRLDTQDLLVLLLVIVVPLLPFDTLDNNAVGEIALQLAVMMYSCEFILGRGLTNFRVICGASLISLLMIGVSGFV